MRIEDIIQQAEGRKLEFKREVPKGLDICKTAIAFANDAGGTIFIGINDKPRKITGIDAEQLIPLEEQISNKIHDNCSPIILPEIVFLKHRDKHVIAVKIYKGSNPPYYLKGKGKDKGTYIRVGSSNRLANQDIIEELERLKSNISFDGLPVFLKEVKDLNIHSLKEQFEQTTGETLDEVTLAKLGLTKTEQGVKFPTHALVLLSDDPLKSQLFPYAKIECAKFKGTTPGNFIDQKSIQGPLSLQAEQAYQFVLRHISQGAAYQGVYRKDRWEYPVIAIREAIRNAVIHRDYSLRGQDIKIAIFDDKIEISSPGKLLPTVDFNDMEAGQSDIRNKVLAPVFKKLGIIEQWGNGLQLIANALKDYPEIKLAWKEPGLNFRLSFIKKYHDEASPTTYASSASKQTESPKDSSVGEPAVHYGSPTPANPFQNGFANDYERLDVSHERFRTITNDYGQLNREERAILQYLLKHGKISRREATRLTGYKDTKTYEMLTGLVEARLLKREGKGRSTYYILSEQLLK
ncbi:MAG TPA: ATP-dependent DNA helicase [Phaeodactylibacter sp.]|nr:ATP-dependent DNA helicase [Phaeodactylibacter sp.]